jgi:glucosamine--fructose-6-phosphate aminotransferase (isomerizing)
MCGIVGYVGKEDPVNVVLNGLYRLEYRGYDSAGIAMSYDDDDLKVVRSVGGVNELEKELFSGNEYRIKPSMAIGHTRWATHGEPSVRNAHPHSSNDKTITLVHNGIIENYETLKTKLITEGYEFYSETDTEVLVNWIHYIKKECDCSLEESVRVALTEVVGAYAILVIDNHGGKMVTARKSSPMAIGVGEDFYVVASDATAILDYTNDVIYVEDNQIGVIEEGRLNMIDMDNQTVDPIIERVDLDLDTIEKGGHDSFMLKEISEQPDTILNCLRGRLTEGDEPLMMGGTESVLPTLLRAQRIFIVACGTSWHAGLVGKYLIENLTRIPVEVDYASEFRYRNPIIKQGDVVIAISQSGETADTKAALEMSREKGATLFGVVNSVGSSIARMVDAGIYTHSGVEIGVASTKAYTGQVTAFMLLALKLARQLNNITDHDFLNLKQSLKFIPEKIKNVLNSKEEIFEIAEKYKDYDDFLFMGRGINFPTALEGALKLKEISYIHAEGYPAGEMKHGPIALIDETCPSIFIAPTGPHYDKVLSNIQEVKARGGKVIAICYKGDEVIKNIVDDVIYVDEVNEYISPLLTVVPLQLLSYKIASLRGKNVDKPRNLAKSVTVE